MESSQDYFEDQQAGGEYDINSEYVEPAYKTDPVAAEEITEHIAGANEKWKLINNGNMFVFSNDDSSARLCIFYSGFNGMMICVYEDAYQCYDTRVFTDAEIQKTYKINLETFYF